MWQIPLKTLRVRLTKELLDLPFEITDYGKVIAVVSDKGLNIPVVEQVKGLNNGYKGLNNKHIEAKPKKLSSCNNKIKTDTPTGVRPWINPLANSALAPKKSGQ